MQLFGWNITKDDAEKRVIPTILPPTDEDASIDVTTYGGTVNYNVDLDGTIRSEADLIIRYRDVSLTPEVDSVIDDIVNEAIITDDPVEDVVSIDMSELDVSDQLKEIIREEFSYIVYDMLQFDVRGYELFRQWYVDGRLPLLLVIDEENPREGLKDVRQMDPLKVRRVRELGKIRTPEGFDLTQVVNDYYLFNETGFNNLTQSPVGVGGQVGQSMRITHDSIVTATSGLRNGAKTMSISYLHAALRPYNQLRMLEDAAIISRLVRAPSRRIWNVEIGMLPKAKADQHMTNFMNAHRNKMTYDQMTGEVRDNRKFINMTEDIWLPKRNGQGTSIDVLPGQDNFSNMDEVEHFQSLLYRALRVPLSRVQEGNAFTMGRIGEITRDEVKFQKFIGRLRTQFGSLFLKILAKQLILKGIINEDEWYQISRYIVLKYAEDSVFEEMKQSEIMRERAATTDRLMPYIGDLFGKRWLWKNVWQLSDDDIQTNIQEIQEEISMGLLPPPVPPEE